MPTPRIKATSARSKQMSCIRSKDTKPEMMVRRALHRLGFRFRLHVRSLPGCPDIVMPKYQTIIQVKGCFWHGHTCRGGRIPKSNKAYWIPKLLQNVKRDHANERKLRHLGWSVHSIWECRLRRYDRVGLETMLLKIIGVNRLA
ncbi:MAG: DNA mismatch endonuclease Vsr [Terracidiphilus sp.]|jgi:DNA mismatch endonuclease (patch repair protein)